MFDKNTYGDKTIGPLGTITLSVQQEKMYVVDLWEQLMEIQEEHMLCTQMLMHKYLYPAHTVIIESLQILMFGNKIARYITGLRVS